MSTHATALAWRLRSAYPDSVPVSIGQDLEGLEALGSSILDATTRGPIGLLHRRRLGSGGMSAVFLAEIGVGWPAHRPGTLGDLVAVKWVLPTMLRQLSAHGLDAADLVRREMLALRRVAEQASGPCPHVLRPYGEGIATIPVADQMLTIPWMAIEYVEGGTLGSTLEDRMLSQPGVGMPPIRVAALARGLIVGAHALHQVGVVHRDLKPLNVLVDGEPPHEVVKIADCGIARLEGYGATFVAADRANSPPEQLCSVVGESNPLIGPWTDVYNLSCMVWGLLAGTKWRRATGDSPWARGHRRLLADMPVAANLRSQPLLAQLQSVLARGASPVLPALCAAARSSEASAAERYRRLRPETFPGEPRYESVTALAAALLPLLDEASTIATEFPAPPTKASEAPPTIREQVPWDVTFDPGSADGRVLLNEPLGLCAVVPDTDRTLLRVGHRLMLHAQGRLHPVAVPAEYWPMVSAATFAMAAVGQYLFVGPQGICAIVRGTFQTIPWPVDAAPPPPLLAASVSGRVLALASAAAAHGSIHLLSSSFDWDRVPMAPDFRLLRLAASGTVVWGVGAANGQHRVVRFDCASRAMTYSPPLPTDVEHPVVHEGGVVVLGEDGSALSLSASGDCVRQPAWPVRGAPIATIPLGNTTWVVFARAIVALRPASVLPRIVHERAADAPPFVAAGFTGDSLLCVDAAAGRTRVRNRVEV